MQNANGWLETDIKIKIKLDGTRISSAEILQISHDAMGQNCATWLISRSCTYTVESRL